MFNVNVKDYNTTKETKIKRGGIFLVRNVKNAYKYKSIRNLLSIH